MGKQKRERKKPHKENPTGLMSIKDFDKECEDIITDDRETALQRVFEEVQSGTVEDKLNGLQTLESMSVDTSMAVEIASKGIAKIIGPLLIDPHIPVRAATSSALRHIGENGGDEACLHLLRDDIMTPLSALLKTYFKDWQPKCNEKRGGSKAQDEKETLVGAVALLWSLCEFNESAIKESNREDLSSILIRYFDVAVYGMEIGSIAAQCMLTLSEDNPTALKTLSKCETTLIRLLGLEVTDSLLVCDVIPMKTFAAGLLMNLINFSENNTTSNICQIISVLSETLDLDSNKIINNLVPLMQQEKGSISHNAKKKLREIRKILGAQQQALEILANLCFEDLENDTDSDTDDFDSTEDESMDFESSMDKTFKPTLPIELIEAIDSCALIKKIWNKTLSMDKNQKNILSQSVEGKVVLKQMHTVRCRGYLCFNNFVTSLEIDSLGGLDNLYRIWMDIGNVIFKETDPNDIELLESATAAMRASLEKLAQDKTDALRQLTLADIQPMLNGEQQCPNPNVRANLIRILGTLALILINDDAPQGHDLTRQISIFLLNACTKEAEVWVMAESLDAIMDVYAEDETNQLALDISLIEKLQSLVPVFRNKLRQQKKKNLGDRASIISTVNTNVQRFIKYKQKQLKGFQMNK